MYRNVIIAWKGVAASILSRRGSRSTLCQVGNIEDKKSCQGQSVEEDCIKIVWEGENKEEEVEEVEKTLGWGIYN